MHKTVGRGCIFEKNLIDQFLFAFNKIFGLFLIILEDFALDYSWASPSNFNSFIILHLQRYSKQPPSWSPQNHLDFAKLRGTSLCLRRQETQNFSLLPGNEKVNVYSLWKWEYWWQRRWNLVLIRRVSNPKR